MDAIYNNSEGARIHEHHTWQLQYNQIMTPKAL